MDLRQLRSCTLCPHRHGSVSRLFLPAEPLLVTLFGLLLAAKVMSDNIQWFSEYVPVPQEFWSFEKGGPFLRCSLCNRDLMVDGTNYLIEKAFNKGETVFEYAMCIDCQCKLHEELSELSRRRINNYFDERVDLERRRQDCLRRHSLQYQHWTSHCMIKGYPQRECEEYQLYGFFIDKDLVFTGMPYILSSEVIDELVALLSNETLGIIQDFSEKLFGLDLPKGLLIP